MTDSGHVARAHALGITANRTLVRDAVNLILRNPGQPVFVVYRHRRLVATWNRPVFGVWRQIGPYQPEITVQALAAEIEYLARELRELARTRSAT